MDRRELRSAPVETHELEYAPPKKSIYHLSNTWNSASDQPGLRKQSRSNSLSNQFYLETEIHELGDYGSYNLKARESMAPARRMSGPSEYISAIDKELELVNNALKHTLSVEENVLIDLDNADIPEKKPSFDVLDNYDLESDANIENQKLVIFSSILEKKNRNGFFQKRLVRFDGSVFTCLSDKKFPIVPKERPLAEFDLLTSVSATVEHELAPLIRKTYPGGTYLPSLANYLIADADKKGKPNIESKHYFVPKLIIPISELVSVEKSKHDSRCFTITAQRDVLHFRALDAVGADHWVFMLSEMKNVPVKNELQFEKLNGEAASTIQKVSFQNFLNIQDTWNYVLRTLPGNASACVTTLFCTIKDGVQLTNGIPDALSPRPSRIVPSIALLNRASTDSNLTGNRPFPSIPEESDFDNNSESQYHEESQYNPESEYNYNGPYGSDVEYPPVDGEKYYERLSIYSDILGKSS